MAYFTYTKESEIIPSTDAKCSMIATRFISKEKIIIKLVNGKLHLDEARFFNNFLVPDSIEFVEFGPTSTFVGSVQEKIFVRTNEKNRTFDDDYKLYNIYLNYGDPRNIFFTTIETAYGQTYLIGTGIYNHAKGGYDVYNVNRLTIS